MNNLIPILGVLLFTAVAMPDAFAAEDYYTWVDENGVTNYAERNPEGVNATFVSRNQAFGRRTNVDEGRPQGPATSEPTTSADTSTLDPDALVDEQAAALAAEIAAIKRQNCEAGKNNLAQLRAFARVRVTDENGQSRILTDDEKAAKTEEARQVIQENCSG